MFMAKKKKSRLSPRQKNFVQSLLGASIGTIFVMISPNQPPATLAGGIFLLLVVALSAITGGFVLSGSGDFRKVLGSFLVAFTISAIIGVSAIVLNGVPLATLLSFEGFVTSDAFVVILVGTASGTLSDQRIS